MLFHYDNASHHTVRLIKKKIEELQWYIFKHPPYSPDLALSDYNLFDLLKFHLGDKRFMTDADAELQIYKWLGQLSNNFSAAGFGKLIKRWDMCIKVNGNYVEK
ncbi:hypothetical protein AVEN_269219-1 [Araneus ventricosus]|uniref:Histone-lysine N-methyltransferase SETMAR n=1 Tax=Araneus ventricosus TaxID=182803 RepID=A0A4Y2I204_ARAVE|nr:hypothetical protein AVEN_269219-1 [Araneus ventricosus]